MISLNHEEELVVFDATVGSDVQALSREFSREISVALAIFTISFTWLEWYIRLWKSCDQGITGPGQGKRRLLS